MNKAVENILERLDVLIEESYYEATEGSHNAGIRNNAYHEVKKIVQEVAEEYNGGWIACSERLPSGLDFVLYTHKDGEVDICSIEYFYDYLDKFTAWQPLPERFKGA